MAVVDDSRGKVSTVSLIDDSADAGAPLVELKIAGDVSVEFPQGKRFSISVEAI